MGFHQWLHACMGFRCIKKV